MSKTRKVIREIAESKVVSIPPEIVRNFGLAKGRIVEFEQVNGTIVITPLNEMQKIVNI
jgi:antitoxin component of MazEF toxin-antitoxin module